MLSMIELPTKYIVAIMDRMFVSSPLDTRGIVNSPSRATIDSEPITAPRPRPIKISETTKSKNLSDVVFDRLNDIFLYIK